ncbi:hypothetical protein CBL_10599 [Carabus blaptoides fortunei]
MNPSSLGSQIHSRGTAGRPGSEEDRDGIRGARSSGRSELGRARVPDADGVLYRHGPEQEGEEAQLVVPHSERLSIMQQHHDAPTAGHYGAEKTYQRISTRYYWSGMRRFITDYVKNCVECQRYKPANTKPAGLLRTPVAAQRFETVHFPPEMWEKSGVDGKRKLKKNAVPTVFNFTTQPVINLPIVTTEIAPTNMLRPSVVTEYSMDSAAITPGKKDNIQCITLNETKIPSTEELELKCKKYSMLYTNLCKNYAALEKKYRRCKNELNALKNSNPIVKVFRSIFNEDQINAMVRSSGKFVKWSNATIKKSFQLKFACGANGYAELLKQQYPLPSCRTLRRRLEHLKFESGVLVEVFDFLKFKVATFKHENERDCGIILDEMSIISSSVYDTSTCNFHGNVTLPGHSGLATHALVIMLAGISSRWKQVIAYYYTGNSTNGSVYKNILTDIILRAENLGLRICSITSDMGPSNLALWREWQILAGRFNQIKNSITHPFDNSRKIYILADVPHLFKNIKNIGTHGDLVITRLEIDHAHIERAPRCVEQIIDAR